MPHLLFVCVLPDLATLFRRVFFGVFDYLCHSCYLLCFASFGNITWVRGSASVLMMFLVQVVFSQKNWPCHVLARFFASCYPYFIYM